LVTVRGDLRKEQAMSTSRVIPKLVLLTIAFSAFATAAGFAPEIQRPIVEPLPPAVIVAGSRVGFTRDSTNGRINVHLDQIGPEHVELLKKQRSLGTVFLSPLRRRISDEELKPLAFVPMKGLAILNASVSSSGLEALKGHASIESIRLWRTAVTDLGIGHLGTLPNLKKIAIDEAEISDAALAKIAEMKQLKAVSFFSCPRITDEGVIQLAQLEGLESLFLNNNRRLTSDIIKPLCRLGKLNRLELDGIKLSPADFADLSTLANLETLGLSETGLTDEGLRELTRLKSLRSLEIQSAAITDAGAAQFKNFEHLRSLGLSKTGIGDAGVAELESLHGLETLGLDSTKVTDAGLKSIAKLNRLKYLSLDETAITDTGFLQLRELKNLESLSANGTKVTEIELEQMYDLHPGMMIFPTPPSVAMKRVELLNKP
jgi:Leucine-rich repeat (LRR) protein